MKIIVLSGGCGVGKLSTASFIAEKLKLRLIHNHLTTNLVREMYGEYSESNSSDFDAMLYGFREVIIRTFAKSGLEDLIMTHANHSAVGARYLIWLKALCDELAIELRFVNLVCSEDVRQQRFLSKNRRVAGKSHDLGAFQGIVAEWGAPALVSEDLVVLATIDTTMMQPNEVAEMIAELL